MTQGSQVIGWPHCTEAISEIDIVQLTENAMNHDACSSDTAVSPDVLAAEDLELLEYHPRGLLVLSGKLDEISTRLRRLPPGERTTVVRRVRAAITLIERDPESVDPDCLASGWSPGEFDLYWLAKL